jgi:hypothetical protein
LYEIQVKGETVGETNGRKKIESILMDDLALVVGGLQAAEVLDKWLDVLCEKDYVSQNDTDTLSRELRRVWAGLNAAKRLRLAELEELEKR